MPSGDAGPERSEGRGSSDVVLPFGELQINYSKPFERVTYGSIFQRAMGFEMTEIDRARAKLLERTRAACSAAQSAKSSSIDVRFLRSILFIAR